MPQRRSNGLWSYLAGIEASDYGTEEIERLSTMRPPGELLWIHVVDPSKALAACHLARRLCVTRPGLSCLLTSSHKTPDAVTLINVLEDSTGAVDEFLTQWRPNLCIWIGGDVLSLPLKAAQSQGIDTVLVDPPAASLRYRLFSVFRRRARKILQGFDRIFAGDEDVAETLLRLWVAADRVTVAGAFLEVGALLPVNEDDRADRAQSLRSRPVWLATQVQSSELETVINAHRAVLRFALRAILVLVPAERADIAQFRERLHKEGLRDHLCSSGTPPAETTQVLLVDEEPQMGLWYRVAPVVFLGSSLGKSMPGQDPNIPAAHGLAMISGPNRKSYAAACQRYADAGALLTVHNKFELCEAVKKLFAPDQTALMARRAWDIGSRGAPMMDAIVNDAHDRLDRIGDS